MSDTFSKIVRNNAIKNSTKRYPLSIAARLTFFYAVSAFGMLLLCTLFLDWVLVQNVKNSEDLFLADKIHILRSILQERPEDKEALIEEVKREGAARRYSKYYVRILDGRGKTMMETPGMKKIFNSPDVFPVPVKSGEAPSRGISWQSGHHENYRLISAECLRRDGLKNIIHVAMDLTNEQMFIADYQRKSAFVLLLGIFLSASVGNVIARQGMKPLKDITRLIERVTASQLHARIGTSQWPKELSVLASEFDGMLDRLEDSFSRLSRFSADLAHELRTPINNLVGEAEVALAKSRTPEEYRDVLGSALEEYGKLSRMIDSLLFLARAESIERSIDKSRLDLHSEIHAVIDFYEALAAEQGIALQQKGDSISIHADSLLLRRALSNLISNSLRYTSSGGSIVISVCERAGFVEIAVKDDGKGIEEKHLPKIFDRFYRADYYRTEPSEGTGLGLAIVKSIMSLHQGTIEVQSTFSRGTTALLKFPSSITEL